MSAISNNVVGLHTGSVWEDIRTFLGDFESQHTKNGYERNCRNFFKWFKGKDLEVLTVDDIYIRNADIKAYRIFLSEHEADYSNATINNIIASIQSLYGFFETNEYNVKAAVTKLKALPDDSERAGSFHTSEIEAIPNVLIKTVKGYEKIVFIEMAYTTSFRKSSLLALTWDDILVKEDSTCEVSTIGKGGKKHSVDIPFELYQKLIEIKELPYYKRYDDNRIFHLSTKAIQDMMQLIKEKLNIPESRNIVFHSFRNFASMFGTLEEAKKHYNHSSIVVTNKYYGRDNKNKNSTIGLRINEKIEDGVFDELSKDEIIKLVMRQNEGVIHQMKREAQKIVNDKIENKKESVE
ncbi:tyrosine-type recombinase/integrase [Paenibacillus tianjinensis]|uniref:Tyrosine-type recombinase/integrase n=1 Tax=Paenibacillus tianjinensis TaxID=2810347 RepID=A0ABX7L907_9BACL|nr:site-specific integrase [Paenibacillus tianjinensis]QSF43519.1 tyrosine-type recombinase/integrase [Paenibacillus tianjinensis]